MSNILNEGFDYHDLVNQIIPEITIDEYAAKMGDDDEIVTLAFTVKGNQVGEDLVDWFERGYDWVLDAQVSEGEVKPGQYLVFVEMNRELYSCSAARGSIDHCDTFRSSAEPSPDRHVDASDSDC